MSHDTKKDVPGVSEDQARAWQDYVQAREKAVKGKIAGAAAEGNTKGLKELNEELKMLEGMKLGSLEQPTEAEKKFQDSFAAAMASRGQASNQR